MKKKQVLLVASIIGGILILATAVLAWRFFSNRPTEQASQEPVKRKVTEPVNIIPVAERPYLQLIPQTNGRNVELVVSEVKKPASSMEFELEYQAGSLLQGAFGAVDISSLPASEEIMFGSCSAGGACTFHTDIKGGTLLSRFEGAEGAQSYAVKQEWRYFDNASKLTEVASKDAKFQLESKDISSQRYLIVYNTPGFPGTEADLPGTLVSEIYSLAGSSQMKGLGTLTIRAAQEGDLTVIGFDGTEWQTFETTVDGKSATAEVSLLEAYAVVIPN